MITETASKISPVSKTIAKNLLEIGSIKFSIDQPFTWVSGIKSPIYCDNRKICSDVKVRNIVIDAFVELIKTNFPQTEVIAGVATGGIPFGVLIADRMDLPFVYVRQAAKEHGLMKQVEGEFQEGQKVVLIEDHISTGGSSIKAVNGLRNEGLELLSLISVMTYGFKKADDLFKETDVNQWSLCDLNTAMDVAFETGSISKADKDVILEFKSGF